MAEQAVLAAHLFDWLGKTTDHQPGTRERDLAEIRDEVDRLFANFVESVERWLHVRSYTTFCEEMLWAGARMLRGDGEAALEVTERTYELYGDESTTLEQAVQWERAVLKHAGLTEEEMDARAGEIEERAKANVGKLEPETMVDNLAWETYVRVQQLRGLAEKYPRHLHSATIMDGWPMVRRQHIDCEPEFEEMVKLLKVGADYPLDVFKPKKRGQDTPMWRYLDPLVFKLDNLHSRRGYSRPGRDNANVWLQQNWDSVCGAMRAEDKAKPEIAEALRGILEVEQLTKATVGAWTTKVLVPVIMFLDAKTAETCEEPALKNIWNHRGVKSAATFKSRLHTQVSQTLMRYARVNRTAEAE